MYDLVIDDLSKVFRRGTLLSREKISAVDQVSLEIRSEEPWILSLVGESGSGKTTIAKMLMGVLEQTEGHMELFGESLEELRKDKKSFYQIVQPIFQNPFTSFSSRRSVEDYLFDTARNLAGCKDHHEAEAKVSQALRDVGMRFESIRGKYSNQFSGGELQRLSIARALITEPKLIIADEPIAMVDASLKMNIVNIFKRLKKQYQICFIYITHDLSTAYYISDYLMTLYQGQLVECGNAQDVLDHPRHPYTRLLIDSIPRIGEIWDENEILPNYDDASYTLGTCRYLSRCPLALDICSQVRPELKPVPGSEATDRGHLVACHAVEAQALVKKQGDWDLKKG